MEPQKSKVYFTKVMTPEKLVEMFDKLNKELTGRVGVKVHTGEKGNINYIHAEFFKNIIEHVKGTVIEANTAYPGERFTTEKHLKLAEEHNWTKYYKVDILDSEKPDLALKVKDGKFLKENYVGKHAENYDSILVLSHYKAHGMKEKGGIGGALKQLSIGFASSNGKVNIHTTGKSSVHQDFIKCMPKNHLDFEEAMAEAASTVVQFYKGNICYINLLMNISLSCDCFKNAPKPTIGDIGILSSVDPVAIDQACYDLIKLSDEKGKDEVLQKMKDGLVMIEAGEKLNIGTRNYELINVE